MAHINVQHLTKTFTTAVKNPDYGVLRNFWYPDKKTVQAVDDVSFSVKKGETVAFIGPNGAGKSTTIKMLTGILWPTSGKITVAGLDPQRDRKKLAFRIGTLFGQRSQLIPNLPMTDSFRLFGAMYELPDRQIVRRAKELVKTFDLGDFVDRPTRKLSLGQRMRAEVALALLHKPEIIFLDEPTIGLDVVAKKSLRETLRLLNEQEGVTIFLTSHDAGDIEALCARTMVINHGKIVVDQPTEELVSSYFTRKHVRVRFQESIDEFVLRGASHIQRDRHEVAFVIDTKKHRLNEVLQDLLARYHVEDVDVQNPGLEEVIKQIYVG
jgi:ABC-2 type transport system ATP-binding protein